MFQCPGNGHWWQKTRLCLITTGSSAVRESDPLAFSSQGCTPVEGAITQSFPSPVGYGAGRDWGRQLLWQLG